MKVKSNINSIIIHAILILVSFTMLVPFLWMTLTAFKTVTESTRELGVCSRIGEST